MKYLINTLKNEETAAKIAAGIVNFAIAASGSTFVIYVIYTAGQALKYW